MYCNYRVFLLFCAPLWNRICCPSFWLLGKALSNFVRPHAALSSLRDDGRHAHVPCSILGVEGKYLPRHTRRTTLDQIPLRPLHGVQDFWEEIVTIATDRFHWIAQRRGMALEGLERGGRGGSVQASVGMMCDMKFRVDICFVSTRKCWQVRVALNPGASIQLAERVTCGVACGGAFVIAIIEGSGGALCDGKEELVGVGGCLCVCREYFYFNN